MIFFKEVYEESMNIQLLYYKISKIFAEQMNV
jgi:hypothetical protein